MLYMRCVEFLCDGNWELMACFVEPREAEEYARNIESEFQKGDIRVVVKKVDVNYNVEWPQEIDEYQRGAEAEYQEHVSRLRREREW